MVAPNASWAWSSMPAAETWHASNAACRKIDLTNYTQVRLTVMKLATAGPAGMLIRAKYRTTWDATVGNWAQLGVSDVACVIGTGVSQPYDSGWINLAAGARADVFVGIAGASGNGSLSPAFGNVMLHFR
jgi:hypothetical protein